MHKQGWPIRSVSCKVSNALADDTQVEEKREMSNVIRVAGVQHSRVVGDKEGNLTAIATWVERAAAEGARIVALPELSNTGYICTSTDEAHFALAE